MRFSLVALAVALIGTLFLQTQVVARTHNINGTVGLDGQGDHSGALVELVVLDDNVVELSTSTNAEGRFKFDAAPGSYQLRVSKEGFLTATSPPFNVHVDGALIFEGIELTWGDSDNNGVIDALDLISMFETGGLVALAHAARNFGMSSSLWDGLTELSYDNGEIERGQRIELGCGNYNWTGAGVLLSPPSDPWILSAVKIGARYEMPEHSSRYFAIGVWDSDRQELFTGRYVYDEFFKINEPTWATVDIPELTVFGDFFLSIWPVYHCAGSELVVGLEDETPVSGRSYTINRDSREIVDGPHAWDWSVHAVGHAPSRALAPKVDSFVKTPRQAGARQG